jgi:hypothetical protein
LRQGQQNRHAFIAFAVTAAFLGAALTGCRDNKGVNAPPWVLDLARQEAARLDEQTPSIDFAACGPATCILRMNGSFRDSDARAPRLDLEVSLDSHSITARDFYYGS